MLLVLATAGQVAAAPTLASLVADVPRCDPARRYCFDVRVHVPLDEQGAPIADAAWIASQLAAANRHFAPAGVAFQVAQVRALPAAAARIADRRQRDALGTRIRGPVIDWFVTGQLDDIDVAGAQIRGVTWRRGTRKFVIVSTVASERVLAHELGHLFGLPHSTYAVSIMNKTERLEPPHEQRTFADEEYVKLRSLARARVIATRRSR